MDFEEWYREAKRTNDCGFTARNFFEAGQQSKQGQINKALELLRQPMQGTVADLLSDLEDILNDT